MRQPCELCGYEGEMRPYYPSLQIVRCPQCALVFYDGDADAAALYTRDYFAGREYRDYRADCEIHRRNFRRRIRDLRRLRPGGRLLEIGCAYGFFLEAAAAHWIVAGLDVARDAVAYARDELGLDAQQADFLDLPDEPESCDVICMWDTLEHLRRPVRYIEKAARCLKPGGILMLTTNDVDSFVARVRRQKWRQIHPPTHVFYFSRATLDRAVAQAGLQTVHVSHAGQYRSYRSMIFGLFGVSGGRDSRLGRLLTCGGKLDFPIYLNTYDILTYTARKPAAPARSGG